MELHEKVLAGLVAAFKTHVEPFAKIRKFVPLKHIPRTDLGKVQRKKLEQI
jgi:acyl-coenzyme A synthetase/AMP-(fatty) acid ligase